MNKTIKSKKKTLTPMDCKNFKDICSMPRDNIDLSQDYWALTDECQVTIAQQKMYNECSQKITIPKNIFDQIVKWYVTGKKNGKIKGSK